MTKLSSLSRSVKDKVVLITGAGGGMGRATAYLFADEGAQLALADINEAGLKETVDSINNAGGKAHGWIIDLSKAEEITDLVDNTVKEFGGINILVNNAGVSRPTAINNDNYEKDWELTFAVNLQAYHRTIRAALPHLSKTENGRIINIASTEGVGASAYNSPYAASKHGVIGLTRGIAVEISRKGITINAVCPGPVNTAMTDLFDEENKTKFARRRVPIGRYGEPEEIAHAVLSLALPGASFITGTTLVVDGGLRAQNT